MNYRTYIILHNRGSSNPKRLNEHLNDYSSQKIMKGIKYTDSEGNTHTTPRWTKEEIEIATADLTFPHGTTLYDKWVAFNFFYADTCMVLNEKEALEAGYFFYFQDEDAPPNKLYKYLVAMGAL